jgi:peptide/nickel transport system substrate-binding protein
MSQYHLKFNPDANAEAKKLGYDFWYQAYNARVYHLGPFANKPHMGPWVKVETSTSREVFERNAFYHEVDTEGQQLPYIDYIYLDITTDSTLRETAAIAGQMTQNDVRLSQIDVAKGNQQKGDFHILSYASSNPSQCVLSFNLNHKDPVKRKVYGDRRFRMAMSYAINRKEMNDTLYFGLAKPYQAMINPKASYFKQEWLTKYAEFDVAKANSLLDEMGLKWDSDHKWRLLPDGKRLSSIYLFYPEFTVEHLELVRRYWAAVGHELIITEVARALRDERGKAADHDVTGWNVDLAEEIACYLPWATKFQPNLEMYYAVSWWQWYDTGGKAGEEPPQEWKDRSAHGRLVCSALGSEYKRLAQAVWQFFSDEIPLIGTVAILNTYIDEERLD